MEIAMKYGESLFDILYLAIAIIVGILILKRSRNRVETWMGVAVLILGAGDAFHLVPRVLNYFVDSDFTVALGVGKLITSITMTVFYMFVYHIAAVIYQLKDQRWLLIIVNFLAFARVILCLFPQNGWASNSSDPLWGTFRNIPFLALGIIVIILFFQNRNAVKRFRLIWLWILLSFAFYIPVAVLAGIVPILGMLMLPKTICYIIIIFTFYLAVAKDEPILKTEADK